MSALDTVGRGEELQRCHQQRVESVFEDRKDIYIPCPSGVLKCLLLYASRLFHAVDVNGEVWEDEAED